MTSFNSNQIFTEVRRIGARVNLAGVDPVADAVNVGSVALPLPERDVMRGVLLQVDPLSTERVWIVGEDGGVGEGISIDAGDRHFFLPVANLNQVWLVASVDHVLVHYWAI